MGRDAMSGVFAKKILQKYKNRVYVMSNAPLAEEIVEELKAMGKTPVLVKISSGQYIAVTANAKKQLVRLLEDKQAGLWRELEELEKYQKEVERSI